MKNWDGKKILQLPSAPTIPVCPTYWGTMPFLPFSLGHACYDHKESESYTIICRHCVDQKTDSVVFTEVHSDHRE